MLTERQKDLITGILEEECGKDESDMFYTEIYTDYNDELCDKSILKICKAENPRETFDEFILECYEDSSWNCEHDLLKKILEHEEIIAEDLDEDDIVDYVRELHYVKIPFDHYLKQDIAIDIMLDTGDANYDFVLNHPFASWYGRDDTTIDENSAILWLARQQGYQKTALNHALRNQEFKESKFLKSVHREISNTSSHMNAVVFLVKMELREYFQLHDAIQKEKKLNAYSYPSRRKGRGYLMLDKSTTCGLYDAWNGSGGVLEIQLEKDIRLPIRLIDSAWPDGGRGQYSVSSIWGLCFSEWTDNAVKEIHEMRRAA